MHRNLLLKTKQTFIFMVGWALTRKYGKNKCMCVRHLHSSFTAAAFMSLWWKWNSSKAFRTRQGRKKTREGSDLLEEDVQPRVFSLSMNLCEIFPWRTTVKTWRVWAFRTSSRRRRQKPASFINVLVMKNPPLRADLGRKVSLCLYMSSDKRFGTKVTMKRIKNKKLIIQ